MGIRQWFFRLAIYTTGIACTLVLFASTARAAEPDPPHWSMEIKGGLFYPDIENWQTFYGDRKTGYYAGSLAYKIFRQLEIGIDGGYIRDKGQGFATIHDQPAGNVTYELFPLQAFVLVRLIFTENQWIVPYVGGGWTRMYYREKVEFQDTIKGSTDGYHGRAGLQFLLDGLDESAANSFYLEYGVNHTYLFVEAQKTTAEIDAGGETIDLGGTSFLAGFLFEF